MSQSRYESLKKSNDTPVLSSVPGAIDTNAHDPEMSAMARKRLVDYFDWLIETHAQLKRNYKESKEPHEENLSRLLQLHPMGTKNSQAGSTSTKTNSEAQQ